MTMDPSTLQSVQAVTQDRNRRLTRFLVLFCVALAALVLIPLTVAAVITWDDMNGSDDPWAGLGLVITAVLSIPVVVGAAISLFGLIWSKATAGPVLAGIGLAINVVMVLFIVSLWAPALA